jgi:hypothetical protein
MTKEQIKKRMLEISIEAETNINNRSDLQKEYKQLKKQLKEIKQ